MCQDLRELVQGHSSEVGPFNDLPLKFWILPKIIEIKEWDAKPIEWEITAIRRSIKWSSTASVHLARKQVTEAPQPQPLGPIEFKCDAEANQLSLILSHIMFDSSDPLLKEFLDMCWHKC